MKEKSIEYFIKKASEIPYDVIPSIRTYVDERMKEEVGTEKQLADKRTALELEFKKMNIASHREYDNKHYELRNEFKEWLEESFGTSGHPKKDRTFEMAWDKGHSSGYNEVYLEYEELSELLV